MSSTAQYRYGIRRTVANRLNRQGRSKQAESVSTAPFSKVLRIYNTQNKANELAGNL